MSRLEDLRKSLNPELWLGEETEIDSNFAEQQAFNRAMQKMEEPRLIACATSQPVGAQECQTPGTLKTEEPLLAQEPDQEEQNKSGKGVVDQHQNLINLKAELLCALMDKDYTLIRQLCQTILVCDPSNREAASLLSLMRQGQPNMTDVSGDNEDEGDDDDAEESSEDADADDEDESDVVDGSDSDEDDTGEEEENIEASTPDIVSPSTSSPLYTEKEEVPELEI